MITDILTHVFHYVSLHGDDVLRFANFLLGHSAIIPGLYRTLVLVKEFRQANNLTQEECAEIMGVDVRTVQRWEKGTRPHPRHYRMFQQLSVMEIRDIHVE